MLLSVILAWISVLLTILLTLKFVAGALAKRNRARGLNRFLHKLHIPLGWALLVTGLGHGLLAGNRPGTAFAEAYLGAELLTWNAGTLCFVLFLLLALSYLLRKKLRKSWMPLHRALTVAAVTALACHLMVTGISLDDLLAAQPAGATAAQEEVTASAAPSYSVTPTVEPTATPVQTESPSPAPAASAEESVQDPVTISEEPTLPPVTFSGAVLADGVYTGSGEGFKGTITVEVTVEGGAVTDITVVSHQDTPGYFDWALPILDQMQEEQSLEVDAVTGATWSSAGLLAAVYDALDDAVVEGELAVATITPTGGRHGGPKR